MLEICNGSPKIIDVSHVKTSTKHSHAVRSEIVYAWATLFIAKHVTKGFDIIVREDFQGRSSKQNHPVFCAWSSCDRALSNFNLTVKDGVISQSKVKKNVVGKGVAEKSEVEDAVREITQYTGTFVCDDESDSVAVAIGYLIERGVIKR